MKPEKQRTRGAPRRERLSLSRLFCFDTSQVDDSDAPTDTSGREMSSRSACFNVGKKRKKEVPVHSPAKATARSRPARTVEDGRSKNSSAKSPAIDDYNNNKFKESSSREASKFNEDHNNGQQNLLRMKRRQASSAQSSYPMPKGNESKPYKIASQPEKLGSSVGVRIMIITLAIMVFVGCGTAIIYLCSCLYILQLARISPSSKNCTENDILNINSAEYKKKVILEGFLNRNGVRSLNIIPSKR